MKINYTLFYLFSTGLLIVSCFLIIVILLIIRRKIKNLDKDYLINLFNNWDKGYLTNIIAVANNSTCPNGMKQLIGNYCGGLKEVCFCSSYTGQITTYISQCTIDITINQNNCKYFPSVNQTNYDIWQNSRICIQRANTTYLDMGYIESASTNCNSGYKPCGVLDSLKNKLCLTINSECPINDIIFLPNNSNINTNAYNDYTKISLGNGYLLYSKSQIKNEIPIEFVISDQIPCKNVNFTHYTNEPYFLENYNIYYNCSKDGNTTNDSYDYRYKLLDTYLSRTKLYKDNNIYQYFIAKPNFKNTYYDYPTNMYMRNYIGINQTCYNKITEQDAKKIIQSQFANFTNNYSILLNYTQSNFCVIVTFILLCPLFNISFFVFVLFDSKKNTKQVKRFYLTLNATGFILSTLILIFSLFEHYSLGLLYNNVIDIISNCSDSITNEFFVNYNNSLDLSGNISIIRIIICCIYNAICLIGFISIIKMKFEYS